MRNPREVIKLTESEIAAILNWNAVEDNDEYWSDEEETIISGIWDNFKTIEETTSIVSLEDGYVDMVVIVQRINDGKYFKGCYTVFDSDITEYDDLLIEVFPKEKTITIYE